MSHTRFVRSSNCQVEEELSLATMRAKVLFQLVEERRKRNR